MRKEVVLMSLLSHLSAPVPFSWVDTFCDRMVLKATVSTFSVHSIVSYPVSQGFCRSFGDTTFTLRFSKKANAFEASLVFLIFPLIAAVSLTEDYIYGYAISNTLNAAYCLTTVAIGIFLYSCRQKYPCNQQMPG